MAALSAAAQNAIDEAKAGRGKKLSPPVKQELSATPPASPSSATPGAGLFQSVQLPDLSSLEVPGDTPLVKAMVVLAILIIGIGVYSKVTGKPIRLGLAGLSAPKPAPAPADPSTIGAVVLNHMPTTVPGAGSYYTQQTQRESLASDAMLSRMVRANPARVA